MVALTHLFDARNRAAEIGLAHNPVDFNIQTHLLRLVESEDLVVKNKAIDVLVVLLPGAARDFGYQRTKFWQADFVSVNDARVRRALEESAELNYEDCPIEELVDEIRMHYNINFYVHGSVKPDTLITVLARGQTLFDGLQVVGDKLGLEVCVSDASLKLLPADHEKAKSSLTYNIKGLVDKTNTVNTIAKSLNEQLDGRGKALPLGKSSIVVKALESDQRRVSLMLGTLSVDAQTATD